MTLIVIAIIIYSLADWKRKIHEIKKEKTKND